MAVDSMVQAGRSFRSAIAGSCLKQSILKLVTVSSSSYVAVQVTTGYAQRSVDTYTLKVDGARTLRRAMVVQRQAVG